MPEFLFAPDPDDPASYICKEIFPDHMPATKQLSPDQFVLRGGLSVAGERLTRDLVKARRVLPADLIATKAEWRKHV